MSNPGSFNVKDVPQISGSAAVPEREVGGITAMLVAELLGSSLPVYAALKAIFDNQPEVAISYLQREVATKNGR